MSWFKDPLIIGGIQLPDEIQDEIEIQFEDDGGGSSFRRLSTGQGVKQTAWQKRKITISASGWVPLELDAIDWRQPVTISGRTINPAITGFCSKPKETRKPQDADWSWSLTIEEE